MARIGSSALATLLMLSMVSAAACAAPQLQGDNAEEGSSDLTGTTSAERAIHFESQVYVAADAGDDAIRVAIARQILGGLIDGTQRSYRDLLGGMRLDTPWGEHGYDPMRVVDGELDNLYTKAASPLTVTLRPPVY